MSKVFMRNGASFILADTDELNINESLPVGTYVVNHSPKFGFYLTLTEDVELPPKVYGNSLKMAERIYSTYKDRQTTTGVLLSGDAGSGKSLLTKCISVLAREKEEAITVLVNEPYNGDEFAAFLQSITQPTVFIFDEFEKTYKDEQSQNGLLTIFDGVFTSKKLFVLTANDVFKVSRYMRNRPGRLFYSLEYKGLEIDFVRDYSMDNLKDTSKVGGVLNVAAGFTSFSFDMLKALVEEMNRYDESATEAMQFLNMKVSFEHGSTDTFTVSLLIDGKPATYRYCTDAETSTPLRLDDGYRIKFIARDKDDNDPDEEDKTPWGPNEIRETICTTVRKERIKSMNADKGEFLFDTEVPGATLLFKRKPPKTSGWNYDAL